MRPRKSKNGDPIKELLRVIRSQPQGVSGFESLMNYPAAESTGYDISLPRGINPEVGDVNKYLTDQLMSEIDAQQFDKDQNYLIEKEAYERKHGNTALSFDEFKRMEAQSGSAKSVAPGAEFLSPVGDVMVMGEGVDMMRKGNVKGGAALTGLSLGMVFVPGNLSMIKSWAEEVSNPLLRNIADSFRSSSPSDDVASVLGKMDLQNYSETAKLNTADDINDLIEMNENPFSGLELSREEESALYAISEVMQGGPIPAAASVAAKASDSPSSIMRFVDEKKDLPDMIGRFEKRETVDGSSRELVYGDKRGGDYIELNSDLLSNKVPASVAEKFPDETYMHNMNVFMDNARAQGGGQREVYTLMNKMIDQVKSGDIVETGSLSTDSYPIYLRQLEKGNKYVKSGGKKEGFVLPKEISNEQAITYSTLNDFGKFSNPFKIPKEIWEDVNIDGMLTRHGTKRSEKFTSDQEAFDFMSLLQKKFIDPELEKRGLPKSKLKSKKEFTGYTEAGEEINKEFHFFEFPMPYLKKLIRGGRIKTLKKAKKGLKLNKLK